MFSKDKLSNAKAGPPSLISTNLHVEGNLRSEGEIQVDGTVNGDVTALSLTVGEEGAINGEVIAGKILVRGRVNGRIRSQEVQLTKTAHVVGDIHHDSLGIESGAHVEGHFKRSERPLESVDSKVKAASGKVATKTVASGKTEPSSPGRAAAKVANPA